MIANAKRSHLTSAALSWHYWRLCEFEATVSLQYPYFAFPQVMLLGSLISELFLFSLFYLSFPCCYFFSANSSFILYLQWGRCTKVCFGNNFWLGGPIDQRSTRLNCIWDDLFGDTSLDHIYRTQICAPNMVCGARIWASQIWSDGVSQNSPCKMQLRPPSQKLLLHQILVRRPHCHFNLKLEFPDQKNDLGRKGHREKTKAFLKSMSQEA